MSQPKKHAKYSASSAHRWLNCPGSVSLIERAPPQAESPYALEGTKAHEYFELACRNAPAKLMSWPKDHAEMVSHAVGSTKLALAFMPKGAQLLIETKCDLSFLEPDTFGTVDLAFVDEFGELVVIDYKYGKGYAVDAKDNPQMIFYALGIAHQYDYNFESVKLVIIQPRAEHEDGPVRSHQMAIGELLGWAETFKKGIAQSKKPNAPHFAGEWCKFCPAKSICPALSTNALAQAQIDFKDDLSLSVPKPREIAVADLPKILKALPLLRQWADAVEEFAFAELMRGGSVPGFKLVPKRATRKWIDETGATAAAMVEFGDEAFDTKLKSPAQLEKIAGKEWVAKHAASVSSGLTLVSEDDTRAAHNQIEKDFR